ncbi:DUF222 domain-containing protein [Angustibacter peucedani]
MGEVLAGCEADVPAAGLRVADRAVFVREVATSEVAATFAVSEHTAAGWVGLAERLARVLPVALGALRAGVLDLPRVQVLAEATAVLDDATAQVVAGRLVAGAGAQVFDGPSPRAWKARVERAVVRADADAARRRHERERAARAVRAWAGVDGGAVFQLRAPVADVAMVEQVVDDLAHAGPDHDEQGGRLTLDQRRADAVIALFRRIRDQQALPVVPVRRSAELGLVVHADTLFGDGPRRGALGQQRGLGRPAVLDPVSARREASRQLQTPRPRPCRCWSSTATAPSSTWSASPPQPARAARHWPTRS